MGGHVHDHHVVNVTSGSFKKETYGANPDRAKKAADLETGSFFQSPFRTKEEDLLHTRNNWICYDFKKRIVPTHHAIRIYGGALGTSHLKSWLVETSADGTSWQEVAHEEDNE
jgi:hypothetical protein